MPALVAYIAIFVGLAVFFLFIHLLLGSIFRPNLPEEDKLTIYECGEPTIGSAWIQFDLRYYVVALLFVIFDVEVAFFFPWAIVFGKANDLAEAKPEQAAQVQQISQQLVPSNLPKPNVDSLNPQWPETLEVENSDGVMVATEEAKKVASSVIAEGQTLAWIAFFDILVFFGVLLVGFAYLWKRGDINWVRSMTSAPTEQEEKAQAPPEESPKTPGVLVGSGAS
ncbi:MAG: NADH-quinone oxidoreductase subunit A [Gemmataceae bacterium]